MKNLLFTLLIFITINAFSQNKSVNDKPFIEVSGQADTLVLPNKIWINVLLTEKDSKGKKSVEDLEKEMIQKLREIGINTDKNVSVSDMSSNFKFYLLKQNDVFKSKSYSILVGDAKTASNVFIGLEKIGISNAQIEKVENDQQKNIKLLINEKAILRAKQIAESFSKPLNQKVGNAIQINNFDYLNQLSGNVAEIRIRGTKTLSSEEQTNEPNIEFEKIKIVTSVQVRFLLE
ncbi:SIMPL domain-containing protein [Flavobacterium sp. MMLR14_040]|uniref:SIMPL domain-containing protein n=1 Tax=Flavobacterium sp. MMLR14_040 TaxID=3093843 RepID=UPI00298FCC71|nr:SIMPL domain-containing protein [Flavobacterium sp. MMLR14_040]MDW8852502.1 SIMPL domain-containing protein [Flavobacterium sp. MMLR14_040]